MATAAAAFRLLLRRRASAPAPPPLTLLQPLFPGPSSKHSCSRLLAAAADLRDARVAQLSPPPVPSLLHRYKSKTPYPLQATTTTSLRVIRCVHPPPPEVPSLIRHYSSQGEHCCNTATYSEADVMEWFSEGVKKDLKKQTEVIFKASETFEKAGDLLDAGLYDQAFAMYEKGFDDTLIALAVFQKGLDDLGKGFGSTKGMPLDILEQHQMECKEMVNLVKSRRYRTYIIFLFALYLNITATHKTLFGFLLGRESLRNWSNDAHTLKTLKKVAMWLFYINVSLVACLLLALLSV